MKRLGLRNVLTATSVFGVICFAGVSNAHAQAASTDVDAKASDTSPDPERTEGDTITVTGTRLKSDGSQAPTPVTVLPTEELQKTTPSTFADALNRLPQFAASAPSRNIGQGDQNSSGAYLNLRRFGSNRNLILLDGNRLPPTAADGSVDINLLPQSLIARVEVVTGGASAVYGSDAVTGVVNFILDKKFNGLKGSAQAGITDYGDNGNVKLSLAGGMDLLGDRGHILAGFDYFNSEGVDRNGYDKRPGDSRLSNPCWLWDCRCSIPTDS